MHSVRSAPDLPSGQSRLVFGNWAMQFTQPTTTCRGCRSVLIWIFRLWGALLRRFWREIWPCWYKKQPIPVGAFYLRRGGGVLVRSCRRVKFVPKDRSISKSNSWRERADSSSCSWFMRALRALYSICACASSFEAIGNCFDSSFEILSPISCSWSRSSLCFSRTVISSGLGRCRLSLSFKDSAIPLSLLASTGLTCSKAFAFRSNICSTNLY